MDGYVSLEVLPAYAHNAAKTIDNAKKITKQVASPNLMVKVPGTKEGLEAIRVLTREGVNVNVTLLFSLRHYEESARAYVDGLRDRVKDGKALGDVCSVASVFVSRIDSWVDKLLDGINEPTLKGKVAVANIVDELIGEDTVNTLPHSTLEAFLDHGTPKLTIGENLDQARQYLDQLAALGIDLDGVCDEVQQQGVEAFSASFEQLMDAIARKAGL
jgi:transaldolase/transaldolase/glucose-6-phosphate isomerase